MSCSLGVDQQQERQLVSNMQVGTGHSREDVQISTAAGNRLQLPLLMERERERREEGGVDVTHKHSHPLVSSSLA